MRTYLTWSGANWLGSLSGFMAALVMVDAYIGHSRSGFSRKVKYVPLVAGAVILVAAILAVTVPRQRWLPLGLSAAGLLGVLAGAMGFWFHNRGGSVRPAGRAWRLHRLMYHAPALAPLSLVAVGVLAMTAAEGMRGGDAFLGAQLRHVTLGTTAIALVGATSQASLLHYRGAFNNPLMYLPLTTPLLAAGAVPWALAGGSETAVTTLSVLLWGTFLLGFAGLGMHLRGFDRVMGGLHRSLPNVHDGPAAAAPALFTAFAAAGLVGLHLL